MELKKIYGYDTKKELTMKLDTSIGIYTPGNDPLHKVTIFLEETLSNHEYQKEINIPKLKRDESKTSDVGGRGREIIFGKDNITSEH